MKIQAVLQPNGIIVENPVQEAEWTTKAKTFSDYLEEESGSYADSLDKIFDKAAQTYDVSKDLLLAMGKAESNFQASATSKSGAQGIMQLMPATAASLGVTDAYDPEQNIMGGAKYISQLIDKYNGRLSYAIAAYNAGSGSVDKYGGVPPYEETKNYVAKVMQYMEDGVSIPDSLSAAKKVEASVKKSAAQASSETSNTSVEAGDDKKFSELTLGEIFDKYFDYNDYLDFIQLFSKFLYEKITGKSLTETEEAESVSPAVNDTSAQEEAEETVSEGEEEPIRQMKMTVHSNGNSKTYTQEISDGSEDTASDAYIAYQNMKLGNTSRISIRLMPQEDTSVV